MQVHEYGKGFVECCGAKDSMEMWTNDFSFLDSRDGTTYSIVDIKGKVSSK